MNISHGNDILFEINNLYKEFPGIKALTNINLFIREREIVGIAGENGAGKSTLMNIISGIIKADSGMMKMKSIDYSPKSYNEANNLGIFMVFQEQGLLPNIYAFENLFLGHEEQFVKHGLLDQKMMLDLAKKELKELGLDIDPSELTMKYSFHERQMLEIAKSFILAKILGIEMPLIILDEPTSGLSDSEIRLLFKKVTEYRNRASFIFISHRLSELMDICDRICIFKDGCLTNELDPKECKESDIHECMVGRKQTKFFYKENEQLTNFGEIIMKVENLSKNKIFKDITFDLHRGEIIGIGGVLGCGKEELGKCLFGIDSYDSGCVQISGKTLQSGNQKAVIHSGVGYVPGDRKLEGIIEYLSVKNNITLSLLSALTYKNSPIMDSGKEKAKTKEGIQALRIKTISQDTLVHTLSGGNQQKVLMAKWILKNLKVLILDNPTRGIDVGAKEEIYEILRKHAAMGLSLLLITDDLLELIGLSNRILIMKDGSMTLQIETPANEKPREAEVVGYMV